jgi:predicted PurR-regulated permease PerM
MHRRDATRGANRPRHLRDDEPMEAEGVPAARDGMRGRTGSRALVTAAALVLIAAGLKAAAPILVRIALAGFIIVITRPAVAWLQRHRVPSALAISAVVLFVFGVGVLFISLTAQSLGEIRLAFPRYAERVQAIEASLNDWLDSTNLPAPDDLHFDFVNAQRALDLATGAARQAASLTTAVVLVLILTVFGMIESNGLPRKLRRAFGERADLAALRTVTAEMQHYLAIKTVISLITGLLVGVWVAIIGLDFPVFWGLVAFVLNFIPNVGSIIAAVPAVALAWLDLGADGALLVAAGYLAINMVLGNMVEPTWMGRRLGLSPFVIMLALVVWGWLWGAIGVLLAVPITMSARIMLETTRSHRWVAILLAPTSELAAAEHPARERVEGKRRFPFLRRGSRT